MAFSGGFPLLTLLATLLVIGNGQFPVNSQFYEDGSIQRNSDSQFRSVSPLFQVAPPSKPISGEEDSISPNASLDPLPNDERNKAPVKSLLSPTQSKQFQDTTDEPKQEDVENNTFNNPDDRTFQDDGISPMDQFWTEMVLIELTSRLSELLNYLESITTRPPLSKYLLNGIDYLNHKENNKHPAGRLLSVIKDMVLKGRQRFHQWITELDESTDGKLDSNGFGYTQYHINLRDDFPEFTTNEPHGDTENYIQYSGRQVPRRGSPWIYYVHYSNVEPDTEVRPNYRSIGNNKRIQNSRRSRMDNNLRQVQDIPYEGFYPRYSKEEPLMSSQNTGYYSEYPDNDYESYFKGYNKNDKLKKQKKQDEKKERLKDKLYDEDSERSRIDRYMKREKDLEENKEPDNSLDNNLKQIREVTNDGFAPEFSKDYPYIGAMRSRDYPEYTDNDYESYFKDYNKQRKKSKKPKHLHKKNEHHKYRSNELDSEKSRSDKYDKKREKILGKSKEPNYSMYRMFDMNPGEVDSDYNP